MRGWVWTALLILQLEVGVVRAFAHCSERDVVNESYPSEIPVYLRFPKTGSSLVLGIEVIHALCTRDALRCLAMSI